MSSSKCKISLDFAYFKRKNSAFITYCSRKLKLNFMPISVAMVRYYHISLWLQYFKWIIKKLMKRKLKMCASYIN